MKGIAFQPSDEVLAAAMRLEGHPDFQLVVKCLSDRAVTLAFTGCSVVDETQSRWCQGRVQELSEVLDLLRNARIKKQNAEKLKADEIAKQRGGMV